MGSPRLKSLLLAAKEVHSLHHHWFLYYRNVTGHTVTMWNPLITHSDHFSCSVKTTRLDARRLALDSNRTQYATVSFCTHYITKKERAFSSTEHGFLWFVWFITTFHPYIKYSRFRVHAVHDVFHWIVTILDPVHHHARWRIRLAQI